MALPMGTKLWKGLMMLVFLAHIPFYASTPHLVSLLGYFLAAINLANISFAITGNVMSLSATHFVAWPAILVYGVNLYYV